MKLFDTLIRTRGLKSAFLKSFLFWNPVINVFLALAFYPDNFSQSFWPGFFISSTCSLTCFGACWVAVTVETWWRKLKNLPRPRHGRHWYYGISLTAMPLGMYIAVILGSPLFPLAHIRNTFDYYRTGIIIGTGFAFCFFLLNSRRDAKDAAQAAENEKLRAQISALTAQMNPHLLFNALNTVAALVPTDPAAAEDTIIRLSELYRGVLDASRKSTHSLKSELDLCRSYLDIEKARFGERLKIEVNIDEAVDVEKMSIPVLCLQPIVENSVRHGLSSRASGGQVSIRALSAPQDEIVLLEVEDDGVGFGNSSHRNGTGTGIANCRERIKLQYGGRGNLQIDPVPGGGTKVILSLPRSLPC